MAERYRWQLEFDDGAVVDEPARWSDLDLSRVTALRLVPDGVTLRVLPGQRVIFKRRRSEDVNVLTGQRMQSTTQILGVKSDGQTAYLFVQPDGSYVLSHDFDAVY